MTIVASFDVEVGTEGDDVVAMTPGGWLDFDARGGNDTICLALGHFSANDRDPLPPTGRLEAGAGDDVVVGSAETDPGARTSVGLGAGNDTFTGGPTWEEVHADSSLQSVDLPPPVGDQRDVISMGAGGGLVRSAAPVGAVNEDRIVFGAGDAFVSYRGVMGPQGSLDFAAASTATLQLAHLSNVEDPVGPGEMLVDNVSRRATVGSLQVLAWAGDISSFRLGGSPATPSKLPMSFAGSAAAEDVSIYIGPVGDIFLAGGDDRLTHGTAIPRSADGGPGVDSAELFTHCHALSVRLATRTTCDGASGSFGGFEDVVASAVVAGSEVALTGTPASERLTTAGHRVTVRSLGGRDDVSVSLSWTARVWGGGGSDTIAVRSDDVVARGQRGRDRIVLLGSPGAPPWGGDGTPERRQVALGGPGRDVLKGSYLNRDLDRLIGGRGRDRANGRRGPQDHCVAEVTRRCELP